MLQNYLASLLQNTNFREPVQQLSQQQVEERSLKYYNSDIHRAAFILPEFARKVSRTVLLLLHQMRYDFSLTGLGIYKIKDFLQP